MINKVSANLYSSSINNAKQNLEGVKTNSLNSQNVSNLGITKDSFFKSNITFGDKHLKSVLAYIEKDPVNNKALINQIKETLAEKAEKVIKEVKEVKEEVERSSQGNYNGSGGLDAYNFYNSDPLP